MLFGWIIAPSCLAKTIPHKKAIWGNYSRQWRSSKVWCICWRWNIVEDKVLDFGIVGVVF